MDIDEKVRLACDLIAEMIAATVPDDYEWIVAMSAPGSAVMISNMPQDGLARALNVLIARVKEKPATAEKVLVTAAAVN